MLFCAAQIDATAQKAYTFALLESILYMLQRKIYSAILRCLIAYNAKSL
jgi:hypothetical protein